MKRRITLGRLVRRGTCHTVTNSLSHPISSQFYFSSSSILSSQPNNTSKSQGRTSIQVKGDPYTWPYDGGIDLSTIGLVLIDWQVDFCGKGGYVDHMKYDLQPLRSAIPTTQKVLAAFREMNLGVIHTREGHEPNLSDCPANKLWRSKQIGGEIGSKGPCGRILIKGEVGWNIIEELKPDLSRLGKEAVIDKPAKGAFGTTNIDLTLRTMGLKQLVFTGLTTDVCVHTIMREANDLGYECLLLSDCTAATDHQNYLAALNMVKMQGGVFGSVSDSKTLLDALDRIKKNK